MCQVIAEVACGNKKCSKQSAKYRAASVAKLSVRERGVGINLPSETHTKFSRNSGARQAVGKE